MANLSILTPSYEPDFSMFKELHKSVIRYTDNDVIHHVIVPSRDVDLFLSLSSPRLKIHDGMEVLGRNFLSIYALAPAMRALGLNSLSKIQAINLRKPWVPLRGWIIQQIVKLAVAAELDDDATLVVDSDVILVRPVESSSLVRAGAVRLYKWPDVVTPHMPQHVRWLTVARTLLDLPPNTLQAQPDYIAGFVSWDPSIIRRMLNHLSAVADTDWRSTIAGELRFSECMLYGTYVEHFGSEHDRSFIEPDTLCRSHWATQALTEEDVEEFARTVGKECLAIQIQSTSHTPRHVRSAIAQAVEQRLAART